MVVDPYESHATPTSFAVPVKQVNRNATVYVNGASAFKPATMVQGGTYVGSVEVYRRSIAAQNRQFVGSAKWRQKRTGGVTSHDAGSVIARRKQIAIGKNATRQGLLNNQPSQFRSNGRTERNSAIARVRSGGCVAPKKKGAAPTCRH